jgi:hypothetical protein
MALAAAGVCKTTALARGYVHARRNLHGRVSFHTNGSVTSMTIFGTRIPKPARIVVVFTLLMKLRIRSGLEANSEALRASGRRNNSTNFRHPRDEGSTMPRHLKSMERWSSKKEGWSSSRASRVT